MTFHPPTPKEVHEYAQSIGFELDGDAFCAYYDTRGWIPSGARKQMSSWQAAVRTWKCRSQKPASKKTELYPCDVCKAEPATKGNVYRKNGEVKYACRYFACMEKLKEWQGKKIHP